MLEGDLDAPLFSGDAVGAAEDAAAAVAMKKTAMGERPEEKRAKS